MRTLWGEQLIQQVQTVIKHIRCDGDHNIMFRIAFMWAQLNTGMGFHLLEYPGLSVPHLECKWMESMRSGLAALQGSIQCIENFIVPIAQEGDTYIMDAICESKKFTKNEVRQINACSLYLKVLLTPDISTPCGTCIANKYDGGSIKDKQNWPTIKYPRQARPNSGAWILWRKALHSLFLEDDKTTLLASLGAWFPRHRSHYQWKYFLHENTLYKTTATKEYSLSSIHI